MRRRFTVGHFAREESGAAAVEFALVSVAFLSFLFVIVYMAIILFANATLQWAVDKGSRIVAINPAATQGQVSTAINDYLASAGAPAASVTYNVTQSGAIRTGNISASFTKSYTVPLINTFTIDYSAIASVPLNG